MTEIEGMAAPATEGSQLGDTRDLDAPRLVIGEVHVEDVELVTGEEVDGAQDRGRGLEIAGHVEHEPTVPEAGGVDDADRRQHQLAARTWRREQAAQRLQPVEHAGRCNPRDLDPRRIDDQLVRLGRRLARDRSHGESQRTRALACGLEVRPQVVGCESRLILETGRRAHLRQRRQS